MATMAVISGKIVIQVTSAILYGGGGRPRLARQGEPGLEPGHEAGAHGAYDVWLGALQPCCVLVGIEPGAEVLRGVESVDGPVFAGGCALGPEDLDAEMARELAGDGDDPLEELLVVGLVTGLDAPRSSSPGRRPAVNSPRP